MNITTYNNRGEKRFHKKREFASFERTKERIVKQYKKPNRNF